MMNIGTVAEKSVSLIFGTTIIIQFVVGRFEVKD